MQVSFVPKAGRREYWEIHVEGERWRDVHRTIFGAKPLFPSVSAADDLQAIFDAYEYRRVKSYVLWRLSKQSYHSEHLSKQLRERLVQEKTIQVVLKGLQDAGYLDDDIWLKSFLRSQQKRYGLPMILSKLRIKGLSSETLQQIDVDWGEPEEELQAIRHLLQTRYHKKDLADYKTRQKVIAALMRKGFSYEKVKDAMNLSH